MAKLSAHGPELLRVTITHTFSPTSPDDHLIERRVTRTFHPDGKSLENVTVRWDDRKKAHTYGWKLRGKLKTGATVGSVRTQYERAGWTVTAPRRTEPDRVISQ